MVYKIRIFSSFCPSENCKDIYERLCQAGNLDDYGDGKDMVITNGDDYTHVIILNTAMPALPSHILKENVVGMAFEPPQFLNITPTFIEYAKRHIGKYFIGDSTGLGEPFVERYSHMWHNPPLTVEPIKNKVMSLMVSEKMNEEGHLYRHKLVNKILETSLPIDIYGRGCRFYNYFKDGRVKGEFKEIEPYEQYMFHICIENFSLNHYFSEKIMNPLLTDTTPVYMGCRNVETYFPNSVITLSGNIDRDMELLQAICQNPEKYRKKIDVTMVKVRISLLRNIPDIFSCN
jgi:hypothetical protein